MPEAKDGVTESAPKESPRVGASRRRRYAFLGAAFVALVLLAAAIVLPSRLGPNVVLGGETFRVEVAATEEQQNDGLSGRSGLGAHQGMLFLFQEPDKICFWMNDMKFNIDILWFDEHQKLIKLEKNLSPDTFPRQYCPPQPAKYVLEVPAGTAERLGVHEQSDLEVNL